MPPTSLQKKKKKKPVQPLVLEIPRSVTEYTLNAVCAQITAILEELKVKAEKFCTQFK